MRRETCPAEVNGGPFAAGGDDGGLSRERPGEEIVFKVASYLCWEAGRIHRAHPAGHPRAPRKIAGINDAGRWAWFKEAAGDSELLGRAFFSFAHPAENPLPLRTENPVARDRERAG